MPWEIRAWQERLERLSSHSVNAWAPAIDVYETPGAFVVTAEVPGISREQIELALEESRLTISGQRTEFGGGEVLHYHQVERGYGSFVRTFEFTDPIDTNGVTADLTNGVLTVTLPKMPPAPARRIAVK